MEVAQIRARARNKGIKEGLNRALELDDSSSKKLAF